MMNGGGYARAGNGLSGEGDYKVYMRGKEALERFSFVTYHPTGCIFRKDVWDKIDNKEMWFDMKYGFYPNAFVVPYIADQWDCLDIYIDIIGKARKIEKSSWAGKRPYYFEPESEWNLFEHTVRALDTLSGECNADVKRNILAMRYRERLFGATFNNQRCWNNGPSKYDERKRQISNIQVLKTGFYFEWKAWILLRSLKCSWVNINCWGKIIVVNIKFLYNFTKKLLK